MKHHLPASALLTLLMLALLPSCGSPSIYTDFDNIDLIPVTTTKEGKWSMVNAKGEIVYDSEFKNRPTAAYNGVFSVLESNGYTVYKAGGKSPEPINGLEGLVDVGYLEDGLMPVTFPGKRISLVSAKGKLEFELTPINGAEIVSCGSGYSDGLLMIQTDEGKYGFVNTDGETVIPPKYDEAYHFFNGLSVVAQSQNDDSEDMIYSVIDKSGEVKFKLRNGFIPVLPTFYCGYMIASKEESLYLIHNDGEETKLPSSVYQIEDFREKYIIFSTEDNEVGAVSDNGEIIVRPKYYSIAFGNGDFFLAKKNAEDSELIKIDANGDVADVIVDYEEIKPLGKFGYMAKDGKYWVMLNDNFERVGDEEFFDINYYYGTKVHTDYCLSLDLPYEIAKMIQGDKVGYLSLNGSASELLKNFCPSDFTLNQYEVKFEDLCKKGPGYEIIVTGYFSGNVADCHYDDNGNPTSDLFWNPISHLTRISLNFCSDAKSRRKEYNALKRALTQIGYQSLIEGMELGLLPVAAFSRGNTLLTFLSQKDSFIGNISITEEDIQSFLDGIDDEELTEME